MAFAGRGDGHRQQRQGVGGIALPDRVERDQARVAAERPPRGGLAQPGERGGQGGAIVGIARSALNRDPHLVSAADTALSRPEAV